jgi:alpha-L-fucosidase
MLCTDPISTSRLQLTCYVGCFVLLSACALVAQSTYLPKPTKAQLAWHDTEFYLFFHFGPNTFTNVEWGHGTEPEDLFNPTRLDCDQWCQVAKAAGAKGVIITAKHHDGFCLWPSKYSTHTVRESRWRNGKGDVLRELSDACQRHGLKLGFYLSPWDRNHPAYGTDAYNDVYIQTMTELMTQYGPLFEFWWDGANGEGPNGKRQVYDFHRFEQEAARLQPDAVVFSDIGPGCRWVGNENGLIHTETNWCTLDTAGFMRGLGAPPNDTLNQGNHSGAHWIPAECDVSIRPGWFYHAEEDNQVKSLDQLWDIYLRSVGRGANLILNVPPNREGRIHPNDSVRLVAFGTRLRTVFANNQALSVKNNNLTDESRITNVLMSQQPDNTWATELALNRRTTIRHIIIREYIRRGQCIGAFRVEAMTRRGWVEVASGKTIGPRRIIELPKAIKTKQIRVVVTSAKSRPHLSEIELYK